MVQLYINMINAGRIKLAEILQPWHDQVAAAMGYVVNLEAEPTEQTGEDDMEADKSTVKNKS